MTHNYQQEDNRSFNVSSSLPGPQYSVIISSPITTSSSNAPIYSTVLLVLMFIAWIGSLIDNLLLTYLFVLLLVMLPGLKRRGLLDKYTSKGVQMIRNFVGQKVKKN